MGFAFFSLLRIYQNWDFGFWFDVFLLFYDQIGIGLLDPSVFSVQSCLWHDYNGY
jgi:hypothetical protein